MLISNFTARRSIAATAIAAALGIASAPQTASATVHYFNWSGFFTMLDNNGVPMQNSSLPAGTVKSPANNYQTPISGTFTWDDVAETGSMTINDFDFFSGTSPAQATGINLEYIGGGTCTNDDPAQGCNAGNLLMANMLFNWNGNNGIPVSLAFDASGLLTYLGGTPTVSDVLTTASGATPASDGIYITADGSVTGLGNGPDGFPGYLALGPVPVATTAYNMTLAAGCSAGVDSNYSDNAGGGCMSVNPSGALPLVTDVTAQTADYSANTGGTIGGNPMVDGPFTGANANFDLVSMTYTGNDSSPTFTTPTDITTTVAEAATPTTADIAIGTVADEPSPGSDVVEYNIDGTGWVADDGTNTVTFNLTETVNTFDIQWRVTTVPGGAVGLSTPNQSVQITITDTTAPTMPTVPSDVTVSVTSTADPVTFEGPTSGYGSITASDATDPNPTIEWSLDNLNWTTDTAGADESSSSFGAGANTVYWRVTDATGNVATYQQIVTLNLPTGISGQPCVVDPDLLTLDVVRNLEGSFTMRDSQGNLVGSIDSNVTGTINASVTCANESCTDSGATLASPTPFYGNLWTTSGIRLFDQAGNYTFETCLNDGSSNCSGPTPVSMTVGANQIGAHMLFDWSVNQNIDVVVVWNFGCSGAQLVSTDPDGDGIIGTKMADGPFKGMNAAFDLSTKAGSPPITTGGYTVTIPAVNNPVANTSPLAVSAGTIGTTLGGATITADQLLNTYGASSDNTVEESCVGGCFDFAVTGLGAGDTIQVVLPLSKPIPWYSLYRKYDAGTDTWKTFTVTATDKVETAALNTDGSCPEPGSGNYSFTPSGIMDNMLRAGDQCVQLTITDGGPNDDDPDAGEIADPSGVGVTSGPSSPTTETSGGGGCTVGNSKSPFSLEWLALAGFLGMLGLSRKRKQN